jgi:hypothetical protein
MKGVRLSLYFLFCLPVIFVACERQNRPASFQRLENSAARLYYQSESESDLKIHIVKTPCSDFADYRADDLVVETFLRNVLEKDTDTLENKEIFALEIRKLKNFKFWRKKNDDKIIRNIV